MVDMLDVDVFVAMVYKMDMDRVGPNWGRNGTQGWYGVQGGWGGQCWYVDKSNKLNIINKLDMMDPLGPSLLSDKYRLATITLIGL